MVCFTPALPTGRQFQVLHVYGWGMLSCWQGDMHGNLEVYCSFMYVACCMASQCWRWRVGQPLLAVQAISCMCIRMCMRCAALCCAVFHSVEFCQGLCCCWQCPVSPTMLSYVVKTAGRVLIMFHMQLTLLRAVNTLATLLQESTIRLFCCVTAFHSSTRDGRNMLQHAVLWRISKHHPAHLHEVCAAH